MSSPEPISQRLLQTNPPASLLPVFNSHTHLAAARFSASLFSCLKKTAYRARATDARGEAISVRTPRGLQEDTPSESKATLSGNWSSATGQLQSFLGRAAPAMDIFETWVCYPPPSYSRAAFASKILESTEGAGAWSFADF